jgi:hypothetical protein
MLLVGWLKLGETFKMSRSMMIMTSRIILLGLGILGLLLLRLVVLI